MVKKDKILRLDNIFTKELPTASDAIESIYINGYASTNEVDRAGDVIPASVWEAGMKNYLKNPVILAFHEHDDPVGRMTEHKVDEKGLWIKARISAAAEEVFNLVKDGVLTAFSVSFRVLDAAYDSVTELFVVKELELLEISVVSVPCNQDTLFSLAKSFDSAEDYNNFKKQFVTNSNPAKGLETINAAGSTLTKKEVNMTEEEIKAMVAAAAKEASEKALAASAAQRVAEEAAKQKAADEAAALDKKIKDVVASIQTGPSGAEKLLADIEKRFEEQTAASKNVLDGLQAAISEKSKELEAIQKSKMNFSEGRDVNGVTYAEKEKAIFLAKMAGKSLEDTKFGREILAKAGSGTPSGGHLPFAQPWELEVSLNMENEVRRRLVVAPLLRNITMQTNVMTMPVNPEAGLATWVTNAQFGTTASTGAAQTHALTEITLNAYKLATLEYMNYEEEEDSLIVLMPIVRDAMIRRTARSVDRAFLLGAGAGADPVKGLATYDATSVVTADSSAGMSVANLRALRKDLGALGLDPAEVTFVVSTDAYFSLLEDTNFMTMDKVGPSATILTGQIGVVGNSPVLVSAEFPATAEGTTSGTTNIAGIAFNTNNFIVGNQRGLRMESQDLIETQRKALVASLRTGMTQISTSVGQGVSTFRWVQA